MEKKTNINDGGPAFPGHGAVGMSLRDYFAAKVMAGVCTPKPANLWHWMRWAVGLTYSVRFVARAEVAAASYLHADAMLAAREILNH